MRTRLTGDGLMNWTERQGMRRGAVDGCWMVDAMMKRGVL